jgi:ubiquinone/menaquinone biosynthesis C-methylase UbiE
VSNSVREYFDGAADDFDAIYGRKNGIGRWIDRQFRSDMHERYRLTFENCGDVQGKKVLDIGCGSGRYAIEFAKRGATEVIGIDLAPHMIALSQQHAVDNGVENVCQFQVGDFFKMEFPRRFDICLAIGVFDYIEAPKSFLQKMKEIVNDRLVMSFPSKSPIRTPIRKIRYWFKQCPVYFYDQEDIEKLIVGLGQCQIVKIPGQGMDYFVEIKIA